MADIIKARGGLSVFVARDGSRLSAFIDAFTFFSRDTDLSNPFTARFVVSGWDVPGHIFGAGLALLLAPLQLLTGLRRRWPRLHRLGGGVYAGAIAIAALLNLATNGYCLYLLTPFRRGDINMASSWECSRNDVMEGFAVLAAAGAVWLTGSGWPDIIAATALLVLFLRSALRVARDAWSELQLSRNDGVR